MTIKLVCAVVWMLLIFYLSSEGHDASSGRSDVIAEAVRHITNTNLPNDVLTFLTRKAAHITAYFVLGILMYNLVRTYARGALKAITYSIVFVAAYATSDEFHQMFVPGRSSEIRDVLIDTTAGVVGVTVAYFIIRKYSGHKKRTAGKIS